MGLLQTVLNFFNPDAVNGHGKDLGRNDLCWCGSGRKYKKCHLADDEMKSKKNSACLGST